MFSYFAGDGFIGKLNYYGPILSYVLIILYCMSQPRKSGEKVLNCGFKLNIVPYIAAILYTVIIFLLNGNGMDYLSRLVSSALYYMLAVGAMYEMLQLMGCRVLDYYIDVTIFTYLLSAFTGTIISRGRGLSLYVRETFLGHYVGTNPYKGFFEVHELIFIMGLFIIFLLFFKKQKPIFKLEMKNIASLVSGGLWIVAVCMAIEKINLPFLPCFVIKVVVSAIGYGVILMTFKYPSVKMLLKRKR